MYTVIKNQKQYDKYCDILEALVIKNYKKDLDEIDLLGLLIDEYNTRAMENYISNLNPVELLKSLIKEHKTTQVALSKKLKISPQLLTDILKYRREITKNLAYKLSSEFKLNFAVFLRPYKLKNVS